MKIFESELVQASHLPDIIDEVSDTLTYLVYLDNGNTQKAMICKIEKSGNVTTRKYPNGSSQYIFNADQRYTYTYNYKR